MCYAALPFPTVICKFQQCHILLHFAWCQQGKPGITILFEIGRVRESTRHELAAGIADEGGDALDTHNVIHE
jgi:hypothetical protein